jgi:hypothetical protein
MQLKLRTRPQVLPQGMGAAPFDPAACYRSPSCRAASDLACYTTLFWSGDCGKWRAYSPGDETLTDISKPPTVSPPTIDTNPNSATYGQATVDGLVVATPEQGQVLINRQIDQQSQAWRDQAVQEMGSAAAASCALMKQNCGMFESPNAECTECRFDPASPAFLITAFALMGVLFAFRK